MGEPEIIEFNLPADDLRLLQRLRRVAGDDLVNEELHQLRVSVDKLADELASIRIALDRRKAQILRMAETDAAWREIADTAWPVEEDSDGR